MLLSFIKVLPLLTFVRFGSHPLRDPYCWLVGLAVLLGIEGNPTRGLVGAKRGFLR